jgi:hypothetical protein
MSLVVLLGLLCATQAPYERAGLIHLADGGPGAAGVSAQIGLTKLLYAMAPGNAPASYCSAPRAGAMGTP